MKASCVEALDRCEAAALGEAEDEDAARVVHEGRKRLTDALGQLPGGLLHFDELSVRADGAQAAHDFGEQLVRILLLLRGLLQEVYEVVRQVHQRINKTRVIPHPMRRIGWGCIAGRALARLQLYSIEYGSGAHFSMIRHHQIPMDVTVADAVCAVSK